MVVAGRVETESKTHGPEAIGYSSGSMARNSPPSGVGSGPGGGLAFWTSVSKPVTARGVGLTAVFRNSPVSVECMPSSASWARRTEVDGRHQGLLIRFQSRRRDRAPTWSARAWVSVATASNLLSVVELDCAGVGVEAIVHGHHLGGGPGALLDVSSSAM